MLWRRRRCYDAVEETTLDAVEEKMLRCCGGDDLWRRQYYDVCVVKVEVSKKFVAMTNNLNIFAFVSEQTGGGTGVFFYSLLLGFFFS